MAPTADEPGYQEVSARNAELNRVGNACSSTTSVGSEKCLIRNSVSKYHSGSTKTRETCPFMRSNLHRALRNKKRERKPVTNDPTSSAPHIIQVRRSFLAFLNQRLRVPTLPASAITIGCAAAS